VSWIFYAVLCSVLALAVTVLVQWEVLIGALRDLRAARARPARHSARGLQRPTEVAEPAAQSIDEAEVAAVPDAAAQAPEPVDEDEPEPVEDESDEPEAPAVGDPLTEVAEDVPLLPQPEPESRDDLMRTGWTGAVCEPLTEDVLVQMDAKRNEQIGAAA
jgi:hypothetical protein